MGATPTLIALFATFAGALFCGWRGARAPDPLRGPRMIPWQLLMMLLSAAGILMIIHLARLLGLGTDPQ